mgnify:CR=1 FL=1
MSSGRESMPWRKVPHSLPSFSRALYDACSCGSARLRESAPRCCTWAGRPKAPWSGESRVAVLSARALTDSRSFISYPRHELYRRVLCNYLGSLVERGEEVDLPTQYGHFRLIPFRELATGLEHVALIKGDLSGDEPVLVRMHSSCLTGDTFASRRCECGEQLHAAMQLIEKEGRGAVVYLSQEGRGIGLMDKIRAYKLQEQGLDTVDANLHLGHRADERDYGVGANILHELGIRSMRLMTNNPMKRRALNGYGLKVVETVPLEIEPNDYNRFYIKL